MTYIVKGKTADWEMVCGLEVHCEILSKSKVFSGASAEFGGEPNTHVAFLDCGMPGQLPVLNEKCVEQCIKTGFGLNAKINKHSVFDRKNYFYGDLPTGYQITQLFFPIVGEGYIDVTDEDDNIKRIGIERLHLEQDAAKSIHDMHPTQSYIDFNRAGVGLMEIVSKPDIRSPQQAGDYLRKLRSIVRYLGTCDGNMDQGSLRCDINVSVRPVGEEGFRHRVEIKNVNSVKFVMQAIDYEVHRQINLYEQGLDFPQETRLFDAVNMETRPMRSKENALDYRYFPDPDLPPLNLTEEYIENIRSNLPEMPEAKKKRYMESLGLPEYDARILTADRETAVYFERALHGVSKRDPKKVANWVMGDLFAKLNENYVAIEDSPVRPEDLGALIDLINDGVISGKIAKEVFEDMFESGKSPAAIVEEKGLKQVSDTGAIEKMIDEVIAANMDKVAEIKAGKDKLKGWFVGQIMKASGGKVNPALANQLLDKKLSEV
ncbi:MAG: Asp-tRNA(Asn)/Glu-tRNA(Gln) amidotransferase subunit GatB [Alphaproteobacteria bacterium]|nr:Asp-tRNA(Asn)/Glu-tRNA(Gln) amidotransferase subunit GatB [Alphaproteobacteria bacterium]